MNQQTHVRFDWAIKRLLRDKANFSILEGFLSELIKEDVKIKSILESESNSEYPSDKINRVDVLVENEKGELIIIEIQNTYEADYFYRILFGVSKAITEHIQLGESYESVKKVISVNIIYFDLGQGNDYLYKGVTEFTGIHKHDKLELSKSQKRLFNKEKISDIYPEIYLIKVNNFDDLAKTSLDEWIYFLKNSKIEDGFKAKGLQEANEKLRVITLPENERKEYNHYMEQLRFERSVMKNNALEERLIGKEKGILFVAKNLKKSGMSVQEISKNTGLSEEEIENL